MRAQSLCPPLRFVSAPESVSYSTGGSNAYVAGLLLQGDGTRTEYRYRTSSPFARTGSTANFVNELLQCTSLGLRNPSSAPATLFNDEPGVSSRNPVVTNLKGAGTPAIVGLLQGANLSVHFHDLSSPNAPATNYPVERDGEGLVVADFNGDGKRDVAVVHNRLNGIVSLFRGNGDGTLQQAVTYPVGKYPDQMTAFDFNGDGRADLAVANQDPGNVSILRGNADGTLSTATNFTSAPFMRSIAAADVTGDGKADLIGGNMGFLVILRGNGDATFQAPAVTSIDFTANYINPVDLNKDGKIDLAIADSQTGRIIVMLGAGNGAFPTRRDYAVTGDPANVIVTDVDRDGNLDIAVASGHPDALTGVYFGNYVISVLFGRGDGSFYGAPAYAVGQYGATLSAGDLNGDGRLDLLSAASGGFFYLLGQEGGNFAGPAKVNLERGAPSSGSIFPSDALAGDFNKDGKLDVVLSESGDRAVHVAIGNGSGAFQRPIRSAAGAAPAGLAAGDVNGDGNLDLVVGQRPSSGVINSVVLLRGNGNGSFQAPVELPAGVNPEKVALRDLNGDGRLDIITVNYGEFDSAAAPGNVTVLLGNGNGTFQNAMPYSTGKNPTSVNFGDVNNDGVPDMVVTASGTSIGSFHVALLTGKGDGTFNPATLLPADFGPSSAVLADFNGDGKADLLVANCCGDTDVTYRLGNGDGTFQSMGHHPPGSPSKLVAADFDGNGSMDLAVVTAATAQSNMIAVYLNQLGGVPCTYSINRANSTASPLGDTLGVTVTPNPSSCTWNAVSDANWVSFGGALPRTGGGALRIIVAANAGAAARVANLTIAGRSFLLTQAGTGCGYSISPSTQSVGQAGGNFHFNVATGAGCPWTAISSQSFVTPPQTITAGPGAASYTVAANPAAAVRSASISVAGEVHQVIQGASNPTVQFDDVPLNHPFYQFISMMRDSAITAGCGNNNYCPDAVTTRGQMAVFIIRAVYGGDTFPYPTAPYFSDVSANHPFFRWIQKMRELGITAGCTANQYCPDDGVTRGQMAVFIVRARLGLASGDPLVFPASAFFTDVAANHPFYSFIQKMRQLAVTGGCTASTYCPDDSTTRGQMSVFIVRGLLTP